MCNPSEPSQPDCDVALMSLMWLRVFGVVLWVRLCCMGQG